MSGSIVTIVFEGKRLGCRSGISVAAALWENGVRVLSHSPKYGRPRGVLCARGHCTNCLMRIDGVPNVRACQTTVRDGMTVERQDSGAFYGDIAQKALNLGGGLMPVGFYYKWFTKPAALARTFTQVIRPVTGVGRLPDEAAIAEDKRILSAPGEAEPRDAGSWDCIVIGAGAAGMAEALAASGRVLLVDDTPVLGGQRRPALDVVAGQGLLDRMPLLADARGKLVELADRVAAAGNIETALSTRVVGAFQPDMFLLADSEGLSIARAAEVRWAGGALDVLGLFVNNDLPGLLGPRGLYRLLTADELNVAGTRAVVTGGGFDLWLAAALLHARGASVTAAPGAPADDAGGAMLESAARLGWRLHTGMEISEARERGGSVSTLILSSRNGDGARAEVACDMAVIAGRGKPAYDIAYQLGAELVLDPARGGYVPRGEDGDRFAIDLPAGSPLIVAGEAAGALPRICLAQDEEVNA